MSPWSLGLSSGRGIRRTQFTDVNTDGRLRDPGTMSVTQAPESERARRAWRCSTEDGSRSALSSMGLGGGRVEEVLHASASGGACGA
jgi:hypothetical protein